MSQVLRAEIYTPQNLEKLALENLWLEDEISFWDGYFSFREGKRFQKMLPFFFGQRQKEGGIFWQ